MSTQQAPVVTVTKSGDTGIHLVTVGTDFDVYTTPEIRQAMRSAIAGGAKTVVVDLEYTTWMDSTALGSLWAAKRYADEHGCEFVIVCSSKPIRRLFEVTGLDQRLDIRESADGIGDTAGKG